MRRLAVVLVVFVLPSCGSTPTPPGAGSPGERFWADQALVLLDGLDDALPRISSAGVGPDTLRNGSFLYDALLGYTYVDSCGTQVGNLGQPSARELDASARRRGARNRAAAPPGAELADAAASLGSDPEGV